MYRQNDKKKLRIVFWKTKFRNLHQYENSAVLYCVKLQRFLCDLNNHRSAFIMLGYMLTNSASDLGICMHDCGMWERGHVCMGALSLGVWCGL